MEESEEQDLRERISGLREEASVMLEEVAERKRESKRRAYVESEKEEEEEELNFDDSSVKRYTCQGKPPETLSLSQSLSLSLSLSLVVSLCLCVSLCLSRAVGCGAVSDTRARVRRQTLISQGNVSRVHVRTLSVPAEKSVSLPKVNGGLPVARAENGGGIAVPAVQIETPAADLSRGVSGLAPLQV
eukprot:2288812-Rhodomonas_salina.1